MLLTNIFLFYLSFLATLGLLTKLYQLYKEKKLWNIKNY